MSTIAHPAAEERAGVLTGTGPLLLATEGTPSSDGAINLAVSMAKGPEDLAILTVHEPFAIVSPEAQLVLSAETEAARRAELLARVTSQLARIGHSELRSRVEMGEGEPAARIVSKGVDLDARLLIVGLGRHEIIDRMFGDESALKLVRRSRIPVLAVPEVDGQLPRTAIVSLDFSEASIRAAHVAVSMLQPDGTLYLVHVIPKESGMLNWWVPGNEYEQFLKKSFAWLRHRLSVPEGITVSDITLTGDPATKLLRYADEVDADLIASGSHGHGFFARMVVGSVTTKLLRGSKCAVLVVPRDAVVAGLKDATVASPAQERQRWSAELDAFTKRNFGRRTRLEVDDPELGAQSQETDYPLLGAVYDKREGKVELMLGELGVDARHLSRSVGDVDSIEILSDTDGTDRALCVHHGRGQTLLTLY